MRFLNPNFLLLPVASRLMPILFDHLIRLAEAVGCQLDKVATRSYILSMRSVGLKVLKNKLSEYVRLAAHGETVLVTDRDRVVAEIVPPEKHRAPVLADALLADAVRRGWITPPALSTSGPPPRKPILSFRELRRDLERDRSDR